MHNSKATMIGAYIENIDKFNSDFPSYVNGLGVEGHPCKIDTVKNDSVSSNFVVFPPTFSQTRLQIIQGAMLFITHSLPDKDLLFASILHRPLFEKAFFYFPSHFVFMKSIVRSR